MSEIQDLQERVSELEKKVVALTAEVDRNDDWAIGLFRVLVDVLPHLLRTHPDLAAQLDSQWRKEADRYEVLKSDPGQSEDFHDTAEKAEPTKMLYRMFDLLDVWPRKDG